MSILDSLSNGNAFTPLADKPPQAGTSSNKPASSPDFDSALSALNADLKALCRAGFKSQDFSKSFGQFEKDFSQVIQQLDTMIEKLCPDNQDAPQGRGKRGKRQIASSEGNPPASSAKPDTLNRDAPPAPQDQTSDQAAPSKAPAGQPDASKQADAGRTSKMDPAYGPPKVPAEAKKSYTHDEKSADPKPAPSDKHDAIVDGAHGDYPTCQKGGWGHNAFANYGKTMDKAFADMRKAVADMVTARKKANSSIQITDLTPDGKPKVSNFIAYAKDDIKKLGGDKGYVDLDDLKKIVGPDLAPKYLKALDLKGTGKIDAMDDTIELLAMDRPVTAITQEVNNMKRHLNAMAISPNEKKSLIQQYDELGQKAKAYTAIDPKTNRPGIVEGDGILTPAKMRLIRDFIEAQPQAAPEMLKQVYVDMGGKLDPEAVRPPADPTKPPSTIDELFPLVS